MMSVPKRKLDSTAIGDKSKRLKVSITGKSISAVPVEPEEEPQVEPEKGAVTRSTKLENKKPLKIHKLAPPRPFQKVPASVSATGPRSSHQEGKNLICITRKTPLAAYMRRCKDLVVKDGYMSIHLSAMGAAIPHLLQLAVALPPILPYDASEIHTEISTSTVEVQDEIIPEQEDEDISYQTRAKSCLKVVLKIGDGDVEIHKNSKTGSSAHAKKHGRNKAAKPQSTAPSTSSAALRPTFLDEPEQDEMEAI